MRARKSNNEGGRGRMKENERKKKDVCLERGKRERNERKRERKRERVRQNIN